MSDTPAPSAADPSATDSSATDRPLRVLVTGSTGYIGSRLVPVLLAAGHHVLAATRSLERVHDFPWGDDVEAVRLDLGDDAQVRRAVRDADAVVYLVHSMEREDFVTADREAAQRVAAACEDAGVGRLVYLSGLVPDEPVDALSDHLRSRLQVEEVLLGCSVPATVLRAAMVVGAGSTSYELLDRLTTRIPLVTPVPRWMRRRLQPVAVEDVVRVLSRALVVGPHDRHYDLGGDDVLTYPELLALHADVVGVRRRRVLVPGVPRAVVGRACAAISGLDRPTVESLVDSLGHEMVCGEDDVRRDLCEPGHRFVPVREALERSRRGAAAADGPVGGTSARGDVQSGAPTDPA